MSWLLIGIAIGLFAASIEVGYRVHRAHRAAALRDLEDQIPGWVNQAGPPKVIRIQDLIDELNFDLWETELEKRT